MAKQSAGILLYRFKGKVIEVFLVHPGGPYWAKKDLGVWSVPKGEFEDSEPALEAAKREFKEETGLIASGKFKPLDPVKLKSGKTVYAWALEGDADASQITSNTFLFEWPPHSGKKMEIPEVDKAGWFNLEQARQKISPGQVPLLNQLEKILGAA